uniref:hypothetical protein n=1 Tax=Roseivirga sp. TaxID=1964215 RepID=UPI0040470B6C
RLGIQWCNTEEYANFATTGPLYDQQLGPDAGSSTAIKVYRSGVSTATDEEVGRLQVTYYVQYKGAKGLNSVTS